MKILQQKQNKTDRDLWIWFSFENRENDYPPENIYGLNRCLLAFLKHAICRSSDRYFGMLLILVTSLKIWLGLEKQHMEKKIKKILNHYLKRKCGTVIFIKHGRCPTAHTKESQPDVCRFIYASCHGSLQHFICNGGEACTNERQTKGKCNRNGHFELLEREKVSSSFCHKFFLYTNLLCVKIQ